MPPALSSNWKNLQAKIQQEPAVKEKKRKAPPAEWQLNTAAKRKRLEAKQPEPPASKSSKTSSRTKPMGEEAPSASLALWAEDNDISTKDLAEAYGVGMKDVVATGAKEDRINEGLAKDAEIGQYVAIDCEMVGVGGATERSVLARVSIVNYHGTQIYDSYVRPKEFVTDWRTHVSGISTKNMATARSFEQVQAEVSVILQDRVLVGHAIKNDLEVLMIGHSKKNIRDTSRFSGFRKYSSGRSPSLKRLAKEILGVEIQNGEHSSIEDARATMLLFRKFKQEFDIEHAKQFPQRAAGSGSGGGKKGKSGKKGKK